MAVITATPEWFRTLLSLSLSGSVLLLVVMGLCRLLRHKVSKRWQYYIWLVVIARLLLPFTPQWSLIGAFTSPAPAVASADDQGDIIHNETAPGPSGALLWDQPPERPDTARLDTPQVGGDGDFGQSPLSALATYGWVPWLVVAAALLLRKITAYQSFAAYITAGRTAVDDPQLLNRFGDLCEEMGVKRRIELHENPLAASPLLCGIIRPCIVLPRADIPQQELRYILRHELVHYQRGDIYYKWLAQLALCVHWFNPLVHWMVKELNRVCELSCDEAVIRPLDAQGKRQYGDTLLESLKTPGNYKSSLASITLNETVSHLKERLTSILYYEKKPVWLVSGSVTLAVLLCVGSYFLGAYRGRTSALEQMASTTPPTEQAGVSATDQPPAQSGSAPDNPAVLPASSLDGDEPAPPLQPAPTGGFMIPDKGEIEGIDIDLICSQVEVRQGDGDGFRVTLGEKLEGHIGYEIQNGLLQITDDFGHNLQLMKWDAEDYTLTLTIPNDNRVYSSFKLSTGLGGMDVTGLSAQIALFEGDGSVSIRGINVGAAGFTHNFGDVEIRDMVASGTITYQGDSNVTMRNVSAGSMIMGMNFGTADLENCRFTQSLQFKGDADQIFTDITAGALEIISDFGVTTMENSSITGPLYHSGGQDALLSKVHANTMEFRHSFGRVSVRDCAMNGLTIANDGGDADIEANIQGDIILNVGNFGDIRIHNTGAKRSQYAVEATGFSDKDRFSDVGFTVDGQLFTSDYRYTGGAPYKLGIYSTRDFGKCADITFRE